MTGAAVPRPVREYRFAANLRGDDLAAFREALVDLAGGFTEITDDRGMRYVVGLRGRGATQRMLRFLAEWAQRTRERRIDLEDRSTAEDRDELARRFHFRPETVRVYGEWRNDAGQLIPDDSLLIRVPRRG